MNAGPTVCVFCPECTFHLYDSDGCKDGFEKVIDYWNYIAKKDK